MPIAEVLYSLHRALQTQMAKIINTNLKKMLMGCLKDLSKSVIFPKS